MTAARAKGRDGRGCGPLRARWMPVAVCAAVAGGIAFAVLLISFCLKGLAPFGALSLASQDANNQYLDFFAYFKDVLEGGQSPSYSMGKMLGGGMVGIYSYYLASPFSLLVVFFDKAELTAFFDLAVALKLALAAATCSIFLNVRFSGARAFEGDGAWGRCCVVALSVGYGLCQYGIAQSSNIMWLDGMYLLPLILLGVHRAVRRGQIGLLSASVGASILFNWYTGAINCLFSIAWCAFELAFARAESGRAASAADRRAGPGHGERVAAARAWLAPLGRYALGMALGVAIGCALFLPTVASLAGTGKGSLNLNRLLNVTISGNLFSVVENYVFGATSESGSAALYSGSLALIGALCAVFAPARPRRERWVCAALLAFAVLSLYWNPLFVVFSLFRDAESFWYRYAYTASLSLVFLAAGFVLRGDPRSLGRELLRAAGAYSALLLLLNHATGTWDVHMVYRTAAMLLVCAALGAAAGRWYGDARPMRRLGARAALALMCLAAAVEMCYAALVLMDTYAVENVESFAAYTEQTEASLEELAELDDGLYRVSQTSSRKSYGNGLTANYNEALAYGYWGIAGYSSVTDDGVLSLAEALGYHVHADSLVVVNTSILGSDSLLGVRYLYSTYAINGLVGTGITSQDGKEVYENPYALPLALTYVSAGGTDAAEAVTTWEVADSETGGTRSVEVQNTFVYQNGLYSELLGEDVELYIELDWTAQENADGSTTYTLSLPEGSWAVYGYLPWDAHESTASCSLDVNGAYTTSYGSWLSPTVFYIPTDGGDASGTVTVTGGGTCAFIEGAEQFYALDLELFAEVCAQLQAQEADSYTIEDGYAAITVEAEAGERLFISIPYDENWTVTLNGETIEPDLFADCLYSVDLVDGVNTIEMTYHVKFLEAGIAASVVGVLMLVTILFFQRRPDLYWRARDLAHRYREQLLYLLFGGLTTCVSLASFWAAERLLGLPVLLANVVSWALAVAFAYLTNRTWVFQSSACGAAAIAREAASFAGGRLATLALEEAVLLVGVELLGLGSMAVKLVAQALVVVGNYLVSKLLVFRRPSRSGP